MARRAKTSFHPTHLLGVVAFVVLIAVGGWIMLGRKSDSGFSGVSDLSIREYMENSNALSNNTYRIEGVVEERIENWSSARGRLFSVRVEEGGETAYLGVLVPSKFNGTNIQRYDHFKFKVTVQAETGILEVKELSKS